MALELLPVLSALMLSVAPGTEPQVLRLPVAPAETLAVTLEGSGDPVVMVPGLLGSSYTFRHVRPAVAATGRAVLVIEPLGTGSSSRPEGADYSLAAQSYRIEAVLDSLGVRSPILVCHAVGASICLRLAVRRPDLAAGIVSINGGAAEESGTPGLRSALRFAPVLKLFGAEGYVRGKIRDGLIESSADASWVTDEVVRGYTAAFDGDLGGALDTFRRMVGAEEPDSLRPRLSSIRAPVHLLVGGGTEEPPVPSAEVAVLLRELSDFRMEHVPGTGLYIQEERPEAVVEAVLAMADLAPEVGRSGTPTRP